MPGAPENAAPCDISAACPVYQSRALAYRSRARLRFLPAHAGRPGSPALRRRPLRRYADERAPTRPWRTTAGPDGALAARADRVHGGLPAALRRCLQRALPRLRAADG